MLASILLHWRALCILYGSLLASIAFAVGHHFYYHNLNNGIVSTENDLAIGTWAGMSSQNFNTAIGNTLASLFRTFLSITVTTAYCQIVWHALKARSTKLNIVDAISGILASPLGFLDFGAWRKSALLFPLAIAIWLLPIAPIITPATLTVVTSPQISQASVNVTSVDFTSLNFAVLLESCGYAGPQPEVQRVVTAAAAPGAVLSIDAPGGQPNVSYIQRFAAPTLQCRDVTDPDRGQTLSAVNSSWISSANGDSNTSYGYLAWTPSAGKTLAPEIQGSQTLASYNGSLTLFVATFPNYNNWYTPSGPKIDPNYTTSATVIGCNLMNATYSLSFNWTNGIRDLDVTVTPSQDQIRVPDLDCTYGQPVSGYTDVQVKGLAYASVMDAFTKLLTGSISEMYSANISYTGYSVGSIIGYNKPTEISDTNVLNTVLGGTAELLPLQNRTDYNFAPPHSWPGVSVSQPTGNAPKLRPTLEQLFQNATLRLMTSPLLQSDPRTPFYPPSVEVTTTVYRNMYVYSATTLWLAYGTALLVATITVVAGSLAIFAGGVSYSSSFSTVLRTTSHAVMSKKPSREDAVGQEPLPKHLAEATITFDHAIGNEGEAANQLLEPTGGFELRLRSVNSRSEQDVTW